MSAASTTDGSTSAWPLRKDVAEFVENILNSTFPARLRSRSSRGFEQIHGRMKTAEQWYNAELAMQLAEEFDGMYFGRNCVTVSGEHSADRTRADWAIYARGTQIIYAVGESKVATVWSKNMNYLGTKLRKLVEQLKRRPDQFPVFGSVFIGCWSDPRKSKAVTGSQVLNRIHCRVSELLQTVLPGINCSLKHMQVIHMPATFADDGWIDDGSECRRDAFCLLQILLRRNRNSKKLKLVESPPQHRLDFVLPWN